MDLRGAHRPAGGTAPRRSIAPGRARGCVAFAVACPTG